MNLLNRTQKNRFWHFDLCLNETKTMVLQSRNIMRSLEHFVNKSDNYVAFRQAVNAKVGLLEDVSE